MFILHAYYLCYHKVLLLVLQGLADDMLSLVLSQSHDHSLCIRPGLPAYTVQPQTAVFSLKGSLVIILFSVFFWYFTGQELCIHVNHVKNDLFKKFAILLCVF